MVAAAAARSGRAGASGPARRGGEGRGMILVLDFGSQYTQLIARRIREQQVYCEIHPYNVPLERVRAMAPEGIVLSGGPASVYAEGAPLPDAAIIDLGVPVLGICYGMGILTMLAGGRHERSLRGSRHRRRRARGVDESRRPNRDAPRRLRGAGVEPQLTGRRLPRPCAAPLRPAVPSRGRAHRPGHGDLPQLPLSRLRRSAARSSASAPTSTAPVCCARSPAASTRP